MTDRTPGTNPLQMAHGTCMCRARALAFSDEKYLVCNQREAINWLDIDHAEHRYLLAASSDCSIAAYDVLEPTCVRTRSQLDKHEPLFKIDKAFPGGHQYAVSTVSWYPVDTGLFVSGGHDKVLKARRSCTNLAALFPHVCRVESCAASMRLITPEYSACRNLANLQCP